MPRKTEGSHVPFMPQKMLIVFLDEDDNPENALVSRAGHVEIMTNYDIYDTRYTITVETGRFDIIRLDGRT